jgi:uncharacterized circularly permuted ATP-grasp superfamily protein
VCAHADEATLDEVRDELARRPSEFIAQRVVPLSCHPTIVDGGASSPGTSTSGRSCSRQM